MNGQFGWCTLAMLGLIGCGGASGKVETVADPVEMRAAPAGTATLAFLDLQSSIRPDALPQTVLLPPEAEKALGLSVAGALPACVQASTVGSATTFTYTNCKAASTGALNGTIVATMAVPSAGHTVYTQVFKLTSTLDATRSWHYTGSQTVTISGASAVVSAVPGSAITVAFVDTGVPANNKTYVFTPALTMNWAVAGRFIMDGSYSFARAGGETISVTIAPAAPLLWVTGCDYPTSGTLTLALASPVTGNASTEAVFGPACGEMTISGGKINLGSH